MRVNQVLNTDSYKFSHWLQYPPGTENVFSYIESRGGEYARTLFFGLQIYLQGVLSKRVTSEDVFEAEEVAKAHGLPFNRAGWLGVVTKHKGKMPLRVKAVPEGSVVPVSNVLVTVEATDPEFFWLPSYVETGMLRAVWYPTTVATISFGIKKLIRRFLLETADNLDGLPFKLHDFGSRGVSSKESAGIGGCAHLVNFKGTDTVEALLYAREYYDEKMAGFSIPAAEHSTVTAYGKENEVEAYRTMLRMFAKPGAVLAVVSDSYDIFNACEKLWGGELKDEVIESGATVVIRPDSGDPPKVVLECLNILSEKFGYSITGQGYKLLNHVRVIQGDGVNPKSIEEILNQMKCNGWSADNLAFGMGGALLQGMDRDTQQFAMKASAVKINGKWVDVWKDPVTDPGKWSKRGRVDLYADPAGERDFHTALEIPSSESALKVVFEDGELKNKQSLEAIRARSEIFLI